MICKCGKPISKTSKNCRPCWDKIRGTSNGLAESSIYNRWYLMKRRCYRKSDPRYEDYGGRGIKVCDRWLVFLNYYEDMGQPPFKGAQIDRIDNDKDYEPSNCKWVTPSENSQNMRRAKKNKDKFKTLSKNDLCFDCIKKHF
ncbi:hypothetical protein JST99_03925 [Candidatus Dependentiae bacterium]|nr:hypothetical protein [Candidatus Dependentiae bacterium]MCC7415372.1 hypothetical protein [Campylobacterota bacterium]